MAVITISRQFGAGGKTVGEKLAKDLGYTFADDLVIQKIAEAAKVSPNFVKSVENEAGTLVTKMISSMLTKSYVERIVGEEHGYMDEKLYLDYLVVIIAQMAEEGDVVILGRGSQYVLNDHPDAFHVLLINDYDNRVRFMMKNYNISEKQAISTITSEDKRRKNMYLKLGKTDYDNPSLYHMVLNMSKVNVDTSIRLIRELAKV